MKLAGSKKALALFFALLLLPAAGCSSRKITNTGAEGKCIVCFGDSLTMGYGVDKGEDFPSCLSKKLNVPVINAGIDGDTSSEALKRLKTDVLDRDPILVIIEFGGNDFLRKIPLSKSVANIEDMVKQILAKGKMVAIADIGTSMVMSEFSSEYRKLAFKYGLIFIPNMMGGIFTNPSLKSDFIHPNAKGYSMICNRVLLAIEPYIKHCVNNTKRISPQK